MAITVEVNTHDIASGSHNVLTIPAQSVSGGATAIFCGITVQTGTNRTISSVTWNGNSLQQIGSHNASDGPRNTVYWWGLLNPVTGGPADLVITFANNVNRSCASLIGVFGGSTDELFENNFVGNDGALEGSNQPTLDIVTASPGALVLSAYQHRNSQPDVGPANQLVYQEQVVGDDHGCQYSIEPSAGPASHIWTPPNYTNTQWAGAGFSYAAGDEPGPGPGVTPVIMHSLRQHSEH